MNANQYFKTSILLVFIFFNLTLCYSQQVDSLLITPHNVKGFLVREYDGMSTSDIYKALKKWTQYNIYNAGFAIQSDVENEYLAFNVNGVGEIRYKESDNWLWKLNLHVECRVKDNKLRLDIVVKQIDGVSPPTLEDLPINPNGGIKAMNSLFKKNGEPRSTTQTYRDDVNRSLNEFAENLFNSINGNVDYKKDDW